MECIDKHTLDSAIGAIPGLKGEDDSGLLDVLILAALHAPAAAPYLCVFAGSEAEVRTARSRRLTTLPAAPHLHAYLSCLLRRS